VLAPQERVRERVEVRAVLREQAIGLELALLDDPPHLGVDQLRGRLAAGLLLERRRQALVRRGDEAGRTQRSRAGSASPASACRGSCRPRRVAVVTRSPWRGAAVSASTTGDRHAETPRAAGRLARSYEAAEERRFRLRDLDPPTPLVRAR
jgi:hypothetical protein